MMKVTRRTERGSQWLPTLESVLLDPASQISPTLYCYPTIYMACIPCPGDVIHVLTPSWHASPSLSHT